MVVAINTKSGEMNRTPGIGYAQKGEAVPKKKHTTSLCLTRKTTSRLAAWGRNHWSDWGDFTSSGCPAGSLAMSLLSRLPKMGPVRPASEAKLHIFAHYRTRSPSKLRIGDSGRGPPGIRQVALRDQSTRTDPP